MNINKQDIIDDYKGVFAGRFGGSFVEFAEPAVKQSAKLALDIIEFLETDSCEGYESEDDRKDEFHHKCKYLKAQLNDIVNTL